MFRIVSEIYEGDKKYPAVTHIFLGTTYEEARGYYRAHLKTDSFLSNCVFKNRFSNFKCRETHRTDKQEPNGRWKEWS